MDVLNNKIEFKGKSGTAYQFVHCYHLAENEQPHSAGVFVFTRKNKAENHTVLDIQLLLEVEEITSTIQRMKEDGAIYAFWKECTDELACDGEIDDIKRAEDYRMKME